MHVVFYDVKTIESAPDEDCCLKDGMEKNNRQRSATKIMTKIKNTENQSSTARRYWLKKLFTTQLGGMCVLIIIGGCFFLFFRLFIHPAQVTKIHTIQGSGARSSEVGKIHTIEGVVVGDFQKSDELDGIFVQEEDNDVDADSRTSEGIFVYTPQGPDVEVGDIVRVTGKVMEFYGSTQLGYISALRSFGRAKSLPVVTEIFLPLPYDYFLERYESMLGQFSQTLTVTNTYDLGRYGQLALSSGGRLMTPTQVAIPGAVANAVQTANNLNQIFLDDGSRLKYPDPIIHPAPGLSAAHTLRVGDQVADVTGVLHYSFNHYRLHPTSILEFVTANVRQKEPAPVGGTLKVASFNLENYFATIDNGHNNARGADSAPEFTRQHEKIIAAIVAMDADILGISELENDEDETITNLIAGLNQATNSKTYASIHTGKLGHDQIRVALIYQPSSVTPVGASLKDAHPIFQRPPLAQTFEDSSGERVTLVVNHFKSKRCQNASGADRDQKDGQACYNATRVKQTVQLLAFIETVVIPNSADPDVLIIGDLNAYAKEDPIITLTQAGYTNVIDRFVGESTYSYIFSGQSGYLSHVLASNSLIARVTGGTIWHINADEPRVLDYNAEDKAPEQLKTLYHDDPYRSSDHDPVLIGLDLNSQN